MLEFQCLKGSLFWNNVTIVKWIIFGSFAEEAEKNDPYCKKVQESMQSLWMPIRFIDLYVLYFQMELFST